MDPLLVELANKDTRLPGIMQAFIDSMTRKSELLDPGAIPIPDIPEVTRELLLASKTDPEIRENVATGLFGIALSNNVLKLDKEFGPGNYPVAEAYRNTLNGFINYDLGSFSTPLAEATGDTLETSPVMNEQLPLAKPGTDIYEGSQQEQAQRAYEEDNLPTRDQPAMLGAGNRRIPPRLQDPAEPLTTEDKFAEATGAFLFNAVNSASMGLLDVLGFGLKKSGILKSNFWDDLRKSRNVLGMDMGAGGLGEGDTEGGKIAAMGGNLAGFGINLLNPVTAATKLTGAATRAVVRRQVVKGLAKATAEATPVVAETAKALRTAKTGFASAARIGAKEAASLTPRAERVAMQAKKMAEAEAAIMRLPEGAQAAAREALKKEAGLLGSDAAVPAMIGEGTQMATVRAFFSGGGTTAERVAAAKQIGIATARAEAVSLVEKGVGARSLKAAADASKMVSGYLAKRPVAGFLANPAKWTFGHVGEASRNTMRKAMAKMYNSQTPGTIFSGTIAKEMVTQKVGSEAAMVMPRLLETIGGEKALSEIMHEAALQTVNGARAVARRGASGLTAEMAKDSMIATAKRGMATNLNRGLSVAMKKNGIKVLDEELAASMDYLGVMGEKLVEGVIKEATFAAGKATLSPMNIVFGTGAGGVFPIAQRLGLVIGDNGITAKLGKSALKFLDEAWGHQANMVAMGLTMRTADSMITPAELWSEEMGGDAGSFRGAVRWTLFGADGKPDKNIFTDDGIFHDMFVGLAFAAGPAATQKLLSKWKFDKSRAPMGDLLRIMRGGGGTDFDAAVGQTDHNLLQLFRRISSATGGGEKAVEGLFGRKDPTAHLDVLFRNKTAAAGVARQYLKVSSDTVPKAIEDIMWGSGNRSFTEQTIQDMLNGNPEAKEIIHSTLKSAYSGLLSVYKKKAGQEMLADLMNTAAGAFVTAGMSQPQLVVDALSGNELDPYAVAEHIIFSTLAARHPYVDPASRDHLRLPGRTQRMSAELMRRHAGAKLLHLGYVDASYIPPHSGLLDPFAKPATEDGKKLHGAISDAMNETVADVLAGVGAGPSKELPVLTKERERDIIYLGDSLADYAARGGEVPEGYFFIKGGNYVNNSTIRDNLHRLAIKLEDKLVDLKLMTRDEGLAPKVNDRGPLQRLQVAEHARVLNGIQRSAIDAFDELLIGGILRTPEFNGRISHIRVRGEGGDKIADRFNDIVDLWSMIGSSRGKGLVDAYGSDIELATGDASKMFPAQEREQIISRAEAMLRTKPQKGLSNKDVWLAREGDESSFNRLHKYLVGEASAMKGEATIATIKRITDGFERKWREVAGVDDASELSLGTFITTKGDRQTSVLQRHYESALTSTAVSESAEFVLGHQNRYLYRDPQDIAAGGTPLNMQIINEHIASIIAGPGSSIAVNVKTTLEGGEKRLWLRPLPSPGAGGLDAFEYTKLRNLYRLLEDSGYAVISQDPSVEVASADALRKAFFKRSSLIGAEVPVAEGVEPLKRVNVDSIMRMFEEIGLDMSDTAFINGLRREIDVVRRGKVSIRMRAAKMEFAQLASGQLLSYGIDGRPRLNMPITANAVRGQTLQKTLKPLVDLIKLKEGKLKLEDFEQLKKDHGIGILDLTPEQFKTFWDLGNEMIEQGIVEGWAHEGYTNKFGVKEYGGAIRNITADELAVENKRIGTFLDWYKTYGDIGYAQQVQTTIGMWQDGINEILTGSRTLPEDSPPSDWKHAAKMLNRELYKVGLKKKGKKVFPLSSAEQARFWRVVDSAMMMTKDIVVEKDGKGRITGVKFTSVRGIDNLRENLAKAHNDEMESYRTRMDAFTEPEAKRIADFMGKHFPDRHADTISSLTNKLGITRDSRVLKELRHKMGLWRDRIILDNADLQLDTLRSDFLAASAANLTGKQATDAAAEIESLFKDSPHTMARIAMDLSMPRIKVYRERVTEGFDTQPNTPGEMEAALTLGAGGKPVQKSRESAEFEEYSAVLVDQSKVRFMRDSGLNMGEMESDGIRDLDATFKAFQRGDVTAINRLRDMAGKSTYEKTTADSHWMVDNGSNENYVMIELPNSKEKVTKFVSYLRDMIKSVDPSGQGLLSEGNYGSEWFRSTVRKAKIYADELEAMSTRAKTERIWDEWQAGGGEGGRPGDLVGLHDIMHLVQYGRMVGTDWTRLGEFMSDVSKDPGKTSKDFRYRMKLLSTSSSKTKPMAVTHPRIAELVAREYLKTFNLGELEDYIYDPSVPLGGIKGPNKPHRFLQRTADGRLAVRAGISDTKIKGSFEADGQEFTSSEFIGLMNGIFGFSPDAANPDGVLKGRWVMIEKEGTLATKGLLAFSPAWEATLRRNNLGVIMTTDEIKVALGKDPHNGVAMKVGRNWFRKPRATGGFEMLDSPNDIIATDKEARDQGLDYSESGVVLLPLEAFMHQARIPTTHVGSGRSIQEGNFRSFAFSEGLYESAFAENLAAFRQVYEHLLVGDKAEDLSAAREFIRSQMSYGSDEFSDMSVMEQYFEGGGVAASGRHYGFSKKLESLVHSMAVEGYIKKGRSQYGFRSPAVFDDYKTLKGDEVMASHFVREAKMLRSQTTLALNIGDPEKAARLNKERWYNKAHLTDHFNTNAPDASKREDSSYVYFRLNELSVLQEHIKGLKDPSLEPIADALPWVMGQEWITFADAQGRAKRMAAVAKDPGLESRLLDAYMMTHRATKDSKGNITQTDGEITAGAILDALHLVLGGYDYHGGGIRSKVDIGLVAAMHRNPSTEINDTLPTIIKGFLTEREGNAYRASAETVARIQKGDYDKDESDFSFNNTDNLMGEIIRLRGITGGTEDVASLAPIDTGFQSTSTSFASNPNVEWGRQARVGSQGIGILMKRFGAISQFLAKMPSFEYTEGTSGKKIRVTPKSRYRDAIDPMVVLQDDSYAMLRMINALQNAMIDAQKNPSKYSPQQLDNEGHFVARMMNHIYNVSVVESPIQETPTSLGISRDGKTVIGEGRVEDIDFSQLPVYEHAPSAVHMITHALSPYMSVRGIFGKTQELGSGRDLHMGELMGRASTFAAIHGDPKLATQKYNAVVKYRMAQASRGNKDLAVAANTLRVTGFQPNKLQAIEKVVMDLAKMSNNFEAMERPRDGDVSFGQAEVLANNKALEAFLDPKTNAVEMIDKMNKTAKQRLNWLATGFDPHDDYKIRSYMKIISEGRKPWDPELIDAEQNLKIAADALRGEMEGEKLEGQRRLLTTLDLSHARDRYRDAMAIRMATIIAEQRLISLEKEASLPFIEQMKADARLIQSTRDKHMWEAMSKKTPFSMEAVTEDTKIMVRNFLARYGQVDPILASLVLLQPKTNNDYYVDGGGKYRLFGKFRQDILSAIMGAVDQARPGNPTDKNTFQRELVGLLARAASTADGVMRGDKDLLSRLDAQEREEFLAGPYWIANDLRYRFGTKYQRHYSQEMAVKQMAESNVNRDMNPAREKRVPLTDEVEFIMGGGLTIKPAMARESRLIGFIEEQLIDQGNDAWKVHMFLSGMNRLGPMSSQLSNFKGSAFESSNSAVFKLFSPKMDLSPLFRAVDEEVVNNFREREDMKDLKAEKPGEYAAKLRMEMINSERKMLYNMAIGVRSAQGWQQVREFGSKSMSMQIREYRAKRNNCNGG